MGRSVDRDDDSRILFRLGGGETWHDIVEFSLSLGYNGLENLALIPGTCGAAPIQNIGAYGVELKDLFLSLEALDRQSGNLVTFTHTQCNFGYRNSIFKNENKDKYLITAITLQLRRDGLVSTGYGDIIKALESLNYTAPFTPQQVFEAVVAVRRSKLPDPAVLGNAGSFFKNPEIVPALFRYLSVVYPEMPGYPASENKIKVPAGWLIQQCGFKGYRRGDVGCYEKQALVLVNYGQASGEEIAAFANHISETVDKKFGIKLTPEVNYIH